jgi:flagellar operon protein
MGNTSINNILIPNVSKLPKHKNVNVTDKLNGKVNSDEFQNLLRDQIGEPKTSESHGIKLSVHAARRLKERNLDMDGQEFFKLKGAIEKLKTKGGRESLIITPKAAYIVDVNNNKIVTAIDKNQMSENVFTKIDSTLFVD